jgi:uncharacterized SAM-binding protein YcdF (DUF218 family)
LRYAGIGAPLAVVLWFFGLLRFGDQIPPQAPEPAERTDAVVVLTGGADRVEAGLKLVAEGRAKKLLISGVYRGVDVAALLRHSRTAPEDVACCVVLGYAADSTVGNAHEAAAWMARERYTSVRLVTASYHMPRSLLEMGRLLHGARLEPYPVVNTNLDNGDWLTKPEALRVLLTEYSKYLLALARGIVPVRQTADSVALAEVSTAKD